MDNLIAAGIVILVLWAIVEFVGAYWQILLALAAVGALVYIVFRSDKKPADKPAGNFEYEVKQSKPQLPPMPYSESTPKGTTETRLVSAKISTFVDEDGNKWHTVDYSDGTV